MPFTDDDLKRLKGFKWEWNQQVGEHMAWMRDNVKALLARLEASERKNKANDAYNEFDCIHLAEDRYKCGILQQQLLKEVHASDEAWQTAAGK